MPEDIKESPKEDDFERRILYSNNQIKNYDGRILSQRFIFYHPCPSYEKVA